MISIVLLTLAAVSEPSEVLEFQATPTEDYLAGEWEVEGSSTCGTEEALRLGIRRSARGPEWTRGGAAGYFHALDDAVSFVQSARIYTDQTIEVLDQNRFRYTVAHSSDESQIGTSGVMARCPARE